MTTIAVVGAAQRHYSPTPARKSLLSSTKGGYGSLHRPKPGVADHAVSSMPNRTSHPLRCADFSNRPPIQPANIQQPQEPNHEIGSVDLAPGVQRRTDGVQGIVSDNCIFPAYRIVQRVSARIPPVPVKVMFG